MTIRHENILPHFMKQPAFEMHSLTIQTDDLKQLDF